jgi:hypothetical protein
MILHGRFDGSPVAPQTRHGQNKNEKDKKLWPPVIEPATLRPLLIRSTNLDSVCFMHTMHPQPYLIGERQEN